MLERLKCLTFINWERLSDGEPGIVHANIHRKKQLLSEGQTESALRTQRTSKLDSIQF